MIRVLIVDDHPLMREGLNRFVAEAFPDSVIAEASNGSEAMKAVWDQPWDLVLMDISMPGRSGLDLLKEVKAARPKLPVLMLSMHSEEQFLTRALRAGASGYISKSTPCDVMLQAIKQALGGGKFITPKAAELLASELSIDTSRPLHEQLSDREFDVLVRIGRGQSVGEIAASLNLSVKTVSTYRTRVLEKMALRNNAELAQYAIRNHLVD
jgi:two-component system, NarL family, invasion response regulator UvrY